MSAIAEAAGVSERTLFREFPSKADLAWEGLGDAVAAIGTATAALTDRHTTMDEIVSELLGDILRGANDPGSRAFTRRQFRIIAASPALLHHRMLDKTREAVTSAIATSGAAGEHPAGLVADALVSVVLTATLWWASHDIDDSLEEVVRSTLAALAGR